jgi:DnaJ-class molecular chaperone
MDEPTNDLDHVEVRCPACEGQRVIRGPKTSITWFDCGYCKGTGQVSQSQFQYWYDHHVRERSDLFEIESTGATN